MAGARGGSAPRTRAGRMYAWKLASASASSSTPERQLVLSELPMTAVNTAACVRTKVADEVLRSRCCAHGGQLPACCPPTASHVFVAWTLYPDKGTDGRSCSSPVNSQLVTDN